MSNKDAYWNKTKNHMIVTLVLWAFFSLVIFMFGSELNTMSFLGYPLAYYMTAQGSLLAFVIILFWTANKQEKIDEEHGFSERELSLIHISEPTRPIAINMMNTMKPPV